MLTKVSRGKNRLLGGWSANLPEPLSGLGYSEITTRKYLRVVSDFAKHFGKSPDKLGPSELRT